MEEKCRRDTAGVQEEEGARGIITLMTEKDSAGRWRDQGGKWKEEDGEVKERTAGTHQEESREGERRPQRGERALVKMEMY